MKKNNAVGILLIISGLFEALLVTPVWIAISYLIPSIFFTAEMQAEWHSFFMFFRIGGIIYFPLGIVSLIGGIFAMRRSHLNWVIASCVTSILGPWPLGIVALVKLPKIKNEFH